MVVRRGEIWWAGLGSPSGSAPGYRRPVLIVQSDDFNASAIRTVVVAAITSRLDRADAPGNVLVARKQSGLPKKSVVNVSQLWTLDRSLLQARVRTLPNTLMHDVDAGLGLVLGLAGR